MKDGSVEVFDVVAVLDCGGAEFVGFTDAQASFDAAAGHPHGEAVGVMIAPGAFGVFGSGLATEFAAPDDEGSIKQTSVFEVLKKAGNGFVGVAGVVVVIFFEIAVSVPVVVVVGAARVNLNEANSPLH